ncbi:unnamed protein product [Linum tenue]|uniref:Uncharacterized protein n=1 Tax=Linum tenue TaxID=586396 RepID=A0AAV0QEG9_9ROSI|nr:unnamed protein product [Linum tenue]
MNIHSTLSSPANFNLLFPCSPFMANYSILSREESTGATAGRAMKPKSPAAPDLLEIHGYRGSLRSSENRGTHSVFVQLVAAVSFLLIINIPAADAAVPAVFIFGDSLVDTGNNNYIVSVAKSDFPPYGRDFPGGTATGRFGNGRILPDFIGEIFGVKNLLPPYKDPTLQMQDLLTGVSFGSAGAGVRRNAPAQELYGLGARRIGVVGAVPIGCVPLQRVVFGGGLLERNCSEDSNEAAKLFNSKLSPAVSSLNRQLPAGAKIVYFDIFSPVLSLIQNPAPHGFEEATRGCCGTGNVELGIFCLVPGTCTDANKYVFWDSVHPVEKAAGIIAGQTFDPASLRTLLG